MFFDGWLGLVRALVMGTSAYLALILLLRISGKRTLSKLNAFDFVVTVAIGSTLATVLLRRRRPWPRASSDSSCSWVCSIWWRGPPSAVEGWSGW